MTARQIGLEIGFKNGKPVAETLCDLYDAGKLKFDIVKYFGKNAYYFSITPEGWKYAESLRLPATRKVATA